MFEWFRRKTCTRCGAEIVVMQTGERTCLILDAEPHPAGDVALVPQRVGYLARVLTVDELHAHSGKRFVAHASTCNASDQPRAASSSPEAVRSHLHREA